MKQGLHTTQITPIQCMRKHNLLVVNLITLAVSVVLCQFQAFMVYGTCHKELLAAATPDLQETQNHAGRLSHCCCDA